MTQKAQNIYKEIVAFKNNLEFLLEDFALEKAGIATELYVDTVDVNAVILGLEAFYNPESGFDLHKFKGKKSLVHSLAYGGWLGNFQLLPSHCGEFATRLNLHFGLGIEKDPIGRAVQFLKDTGLADTYLLNNFFPEGSSEEQSLEFLKTRAVLAEDLFKAAQCVVPWHKRLSKLLAKNTLILSPEVPKIGFDRLIQTAFFQDTKRSFDERRPQRVINNFMDSAAVATLIDLLAKFKTGANIIPRFYSSSPLFQKVIDDAGLEPLLTYQSPIGHTSSVLRDSDYYIFRASFRQQFTGGEDSLSVGAPEAYLQDLHEKVLWIVDSQKVLTLEALEQISFDGSPLNEVIRSLQMFSFLENVWLKSAAPQEMSQVMSEVAEAAQEIQSEEFQQNVAEAIAVVSARLSENAKEYKRVSSLWIRIEQVAAQVRAWVPADQFAPETLFRDFGLLRYGFPESSHQRITEVLRGLFRGEEETERDARVAVITACFEGREVSTRNLDNIITGAAALLVMGLDSELLTLLSTAGPLPHYSLRIVLAEMLLRSNPKIERAAGVISQLEKDYRDLSHDSQKQADLAVGIAYLYFRLWHSHGGQAAWRPTHAAISETKAGSNQLYINSAIEYAKIAHASLTDSMKKAYALNQYLYYLVEGGSDELLDKIKDLAMALVTYRVDREIWQYRFDDTLARYFHRVAVLATSKYEWERLMEQARHLIMQASHRAPWDQDVAHYHTLIAVVQSSGYKGEK